MTAEQLNSLYQFHHNIRHAEDGGDHFSNLRAHADRAAPRAHAEDRHLPAIAKGKRIAHRPTKNFAAALLGERPEPAPPPSRWPRRKNAKEEDMMQAPRAYLGDRLSVEFDGREYRLFYPKDDLPVRGTVFMGHDAIKAFKAFIELIERATPRRAPQHSSVGIARGPGRPDCV